MHSEKIMQLITAISFLLLSLLVLCPLKKLNIYILPFTVITFIHYIIDFYNQAINSLFHFFFIKFSSFFFNSLVLFRPIKVTLGSKYFQLIITCHINYTGYSSKLRKLCRSRILAQSA